MIELLAGLKLLLRAAFGRPHESLSPYDRETALILQRWAQRALVVFLVLAAIGVLGKVVSCVRGAPLPLAEVAMPTMVQNLGIRAVAHGFRSRFRDWAAACSDAPREACGVALAHVNTNSIEAAYRWTDLFERRRALMEQWAVFLAEPEDRSVRLSAIPGEGFGQEPRSAR